MQAVLADLTRPPTASKISGGGALQQKGVGDAYGLGVGAANMLDFVSMRTSSGEKGRTMGVGLGYPWF